MCNFCCLTLLAIDIWYELDFIYERYAHCDRFARVKIFQLKDASIGKVNSTTKAS